MDIYQTYLALVKESVALKHFKRMPLVLAILCAVAILPFIVCYAIGLLFYGALLLFMKVLDSPVDYLHSFIKAEREEVKTPTQVIIYLVAFPVIFGLKVITSIIIFMLFFVHLTVSINGVFATLGGITFSPVLQSNANRDIKKTTPKYKNMLVFVFILTIAVLLITAFVLVPLTNVFTGVVKSLVNIINYNRFVGDVSDAYAANQITSTQYNNFYHDYENGFVNRSNYNYYAEMLLGRTYGGFISVVARLITLLTMLVFFLCLAAYPSVVVVYVLLYFRRYPKDAVVSPANVTVDDTDPALIMA